MWTNFSSLYCIVVLTIANQGVKAQYGKFNLIIISCNVIVHCMNQNQSVIIFINKLMGKTQNIFKVNSNIFLVFFFRFIVVLGGYLFSIIFFVKLFVILGISKLMLELFNSNYKNISTKRKLLKRMIHDKFVDMYLILSIYLSCDAIIISFIQTVNSLSFMKLKQSAQL